MVHQHPITDKDSKRGIQDQERSKDNNSKKRSRAEAANGGHSDVWDLSTGDGERFLSKLGNSSSPPAKRALLQRPDTIDICDGKDRIEEEQQHKKAKGASSVLVDGIASNVDGDDDCEDELNIPVVGARVLCSPTFDQTPRPAEILAVDKKGSHLSFYVHYLECDKRLDEWVALQKLSPMIPVGPGYSGDKAPSCITPPCNGDAMPGAGFNHKMTRSLKRQIEELHQVDDLGNGDAGHEKGQHEKTKLKNIQSVELGRFEMDAWYFSPYPEPFALCEKLYICEYTLKYFRKKKTLLRHLAKLNADQLHPPGDMIYRSPPPPSNSPDYLGGAVTNPPISVFEVDGKKSKMYCQNLCLLSKLFLDHKTLYYDVVPFLFYVLCEVDQKGHHLVGYFSKEKHCAEDNNLACILTLPAYQQKGYGKFLISFAYELSKREGRIGTPERPLSDLGAVCFRSYWSQVLLEVLKETKSNISIKELSERTFIRTDDIISTLQHLQLLKYWKGQHFIHAPPKVVEEHTMKFSNRKYIEINPNALHFQPLVHSPGGSKRIKG